jgi:hypothetical protein
MSDANSRHFDVFNGDADGLCALQQLRLSQPKVSALVTGVKRDNALLARVQAGAGDSVTVLDVALGANREALHVLLGRGVNVEYFDHHHAPEPLPAHPLLKLCLDCAPGVCTSLLVDRRLGGRYRAWAVVGAFGDNMPATAAALAAASGFNESSVLLFKALGECLNYNAYGDSEADLTISPASLYRRMMPYADPLDFMENDDAYATLAQRRAEDMMLAMDVTPIVETERLLAVRLPDAAWARRVVGSYANRLIRRHPGRLCAIMLPNARQTLSVSLRTPENFGPGADRLARRYGGDGRSEAAGINDLHPEQLAPFLRDLRQALDAASA